MRLIAINRLTALVTIYWQ